MILLFGRPRLIQTYDWSRQSSHVSRKIGQARWLKELTSNSELEEYLKEEILKTGYPLEVEMSDLLSKDSTVFNNEPYVDEVTSKTQPIDVFAAHKAFRLRCTTIIIP
jgi:hypothetical protein